MTSSINFKKLVSVGAALLLAVGGSLGVAVPSSAAEVTTTTLGGGAHIAATMTSVNLQIGSCNSYSGTINQSDFQLSVTGGTQTLSSVAFAGYILFGLSSPLVGGETVTITYTKNVSRIITCGNGDTVGSFTFTDTAPALPTITGTPTLSASGTTLTAVPTTYTGSVSQYWYLCDTAKTATNTSFMPPAMTGVSGCSMLFNSAGTSSPANGTTLSLSGTYYVRAGSLGNYTYPAATFTGKYVIFAQAVNSGTYIAYSSSVSGSGGSQSTGSVTTPPGTPTISNGTLTTGAAAVWSNPSNNLHGMWLACSTPQGATQGTSGGPDAGCGPISATALSSQNASWLSTSPLSLGANINKWVVCSGGGCTTASVATSTQHFAWYENDGGVWTMSATIASDGTVGASAPTVRPLSPEQARNQIKPLPVIVQPLVAALPSLSKPLVDAGGKVDLKAGDFTGLVSASISGKTIDLTVGSTGSLSITVPNGKAGTTADLLLNFKSGTVILQDAIKYVAPVVVAQIPVRPVSIKAGAKKLSATAADDIRHAAFANLKNNSIECVAYAASAATADAAKATAQQACDLAVKSNPDLVNTSVVVVIDKIKAATQGVGIRVYKQ